MKIFVRTNIERSGSEIICLEVKPLDTIKYVKTMIQDKEGIPSNRYLLLYSGKELQDEYTLADYNILRESTFNLLFRHFLIYVKLTTISRSVTITVDNVNYITTVGEIKARINAEEHITPDEQILAFNGITLQDDRKAIGHHSIQNRSILHLAIKGENSLFMGRGIVEDQGARADPEFLGSRLLSSADEIDQSHVISTEQKNVLLVRSLPQGFAVHTEQYQEPENDFNEEDFKTYTNTLKDECLVNNENTVRVVAEQILKWEPLGRVLGLSEPKIIVIQINNQHDYEEQKYQCIMKWISEYGQAATLITLLRKVYFELEDKSLVMKISQKLKPQSSSVMQPSPTGAQKICISYAKEDATIEFAKKLKSDLIKNHYEVIYDEKNIEGSIFLTERLSEEIASCNVMIVILTEKYSKSECYGKELALASAQMKKLVLIIREAFDASKMVGLTVEDQPLLSFINDEEYDDSFASLMKVLAQCKKVEVISPTRAIIDFILASCVVL